MSKLDYSNPLPTLSLSAPALPGDESSVADKLRNALIRYGEYDSDYMTYTVCIGMDYTSDYSLRYDRELIYDAEYASLELSLQGIGITKDANFWLSIFLDDNPADGYEWMYIDLFNDCRMYGMLEPNTFNENTRLSYEGVDGAAAFIPQTVQEIASLMAHIICSCLTADLADIGITAPELGFWNY